MARDDERLGAFDAVMYGVEDDPLLRSVILVMILLDREPDMAEGVARVERMTLEVPKLRQRVVGNPISLAPPRWETDPNFDLGYHLRWYSVPNPDGTLRPAFEVAEQMAEQDFDRNRPLWEMAMLSGLPDGQAALLVKLHHAITDGMGGMAMAASLIDMTREYEPRRGSKPTAPHAAVLDLVGRVVAGVDFEARAAIGGVRTYVGGAWGLGLRTVSSPLQTARDGATYAASASRLLAPASSPLSHTMTGRSLSVRFALIERPLADLKAAAKVAGGTVNDAYMAAVTAGLGAYHRQHGDDLTASLRVNMPVNLRTPGEVIAGGNRWVPARFEVPIVDMDPRTRIRRLSPLLKSARTEPALPVSDFVFRRLSQLPQPVTTMIAGGLMKGTDFAATNVPGPPIPVYMAGAEVLRFVPFAPKAGAAVNIALMSYNGVAQLGVNIDRGAVEDPDDLVRCLSEGLDGVLSLAHEPPPAAKKTTAKKTAKKATRTAPAAKPHPPASDPTDA
jgi:WS/DGAT/MGAT family acyltransferase